MKTDTSILFITHDLGVIHEMADDVAVMYCGQVVEMAPARDDLRHDYSYSHPYTEGLMTSIPRLDTAGGRPVWRPSRARCPHPLDLAEGLQVCAPLQILHRSAAAKKSRSL